MIGGKRIIQPEGDFHIGHGSGAGTIGDQPEDAAQGCFQHRNLTDFSSGAQRQTDRAGAPCRRVGHGEPVSAQRYISQGKPALRISWRNGEAAERGIGKGNRRPSVGAEEDSPQRGGPAQGDGAFPGPAGRHRQRRPARQPRAANGQAGTAGISAFEEIGKENFAGGIGGSFEPSPGKTVGLDFHCCACGWRAIGFAHQHFCQTPAQHPHRHAIVLTRSHDGVSLSGCTGSLVQRGYIIAARWQGKSAGGGRKASIRPGADEKVISKTDLHPHIASRFGSVRIEHFSTEASIGFPDGRELEQHVPHHRIHLGGAAAG